RDPPTATFAARREAETLPGDPHPAWFRRVRRGHARLDLAPLRQGRQRPARLVDAVSLCLARRARPDGAARRPAATRAVQRLEARALRQGQHHPRIRLWLVISDRYERRPSWWRCRESN